MKSRLQKNCLKIVIALAIVSVLGFWLMGCAGLDYYPLDCKYRALTAAHAAETLWDVRAYVATDGDHAQAFYLDNNTEVWLTIRNGCAVRYVPREVNNRISVWSLKEWDRVLSKN